MGQQLKLKAVGGHCLLIQHFAAQIQGSLAGPLLWAADGRRIHCWSSKQLQLSLHGTSYSWQFLLADVKFPILGVDFLRHFGLLVDVMGGKLLPRSTLPQPPDGDVYAMVAEPSDWQSILAEFPCGEIVTALFRFVTFS
jgi:hypothetical protein